MTAVAAMTSAFRSEFTKIRSVRSTYWALALLLVASLAWSIASSAGTVAHWAHTPPQARAGLDATQNSVLGLVLLGQLIVVVLGALAMTSEYSTHAIRTSLTMLPRRITWFAAKGAVFWLIASVVTAATAVASFLVGQHLLARVHAGAALGQPGVLRAVLASTIFVVLCGLFSYGLGAVIRNTAGTITAAYGFLVLAAQLARALPTAWYNDVVRWIPGGQFDGAITSSGPQPVGRNMFPAWGELAVFGGYTLIVLIAGTILLRRRDA